MADQGCVWLYGCRSKSVGAGLDCDLDCTPALFLTYSALAVAVCGLWHYISMHFTFTFTQRCTRVSAHGQGVSVCVCVCVCVCDEHSLSTLF